MSDPMTASPSASSAANTSSYLSELRKEVCELKAIILYQTDKIRKLDKIIVSFSSCVCSKQFKLVWDSRRFYELKMGNNDEKHPLLFISVTSVVLLPVG